MNDLQDLTYLPVKILIEESERGSSFVVEVNVLETVEEREIHIEIIVVMIEMN
jgi:hypothetical protein